VISQPAGANSLPCSYKGLQASAWLTVAAARGITPEGVRDKKERHAEQLDQIFFELVRNRRSDQSGMQEKSFFSLCLEVLFGVPGRSSCLFEAPLCSSDSAQNG